MKFIKITKDWLKDLHFGVKIDVEGIESKPSFLCNRCDEPLEEIGGAVRNPVHYGWEWGKYYACKKCGLAWTLN